MGTDSLASGFWVAFRIEPPGPVWVDLSNGSTQGVPACHRAGAPPKACGRRSARFSSFDRCRCSVEVPALSCASPTRMPLRGQREGACGGAWLARGRDLRRGNRGLLSAGSGGPVGAVFPVCFFLGSNFRVDHSLLCVGSFGLCFAPAWVVAAPSLRCSLAVAPIGAHLPSICCDPAGILPSTSGFPVVGVLVGLYASLQCCHQPINPPPGACRRAPKTTNNSSIAFQLYFAGKVPDL